MLAKSRRLNIRKSFKWVSAGKRLDFPLFKISYKAGDNDKALIGIALSKQYFREAHDRNRARRLVSSAIERLYPQINSNLNILIMPKTTVLEKSSLEIEEALNAVKDLYRID